MEMLYIIRVVLLPIMHGLVETRGQPPTCRAVFDYYYASLTCVHAKCKAKIFRGDFIGPGI